jgi:hypothetical protein
MMKERNCVVQARQLMMFLLLPAMTWAQEYIFSGQARNNAGAVESGASVRVCQLGATGTPCARTSHPFR